MRWRLLRRAVRDIFKLWSGGEGGKEKKGEGEGCHAEAAARIKEVRERGDNLLVLIKGMRDPPPGEEGRKHRDG